MSDEAKVGEIFADRYKLTKLLGSGGMGLVYEAIQVDCNRPVALKVLSRIVSADPDSRARFHREAQALSHLSHINIVVVYQVGITADNTPFLVMEHIDGQSLRSILQKLKRLPVLRAIRIISDAAQALAFTHQQNIVHRDLKPENILIADTPEPDTVKLVDFGLARLSAEDSPEQKLTQAGQLIGTYAYMSPEQCLGNTADFRSDIYSLCATFYELIVGRQAMSSDTGIDLLQMHINVPVPEIKADQVDCFHPVLNQIICKGMAKSPEERFSSMDELHRELENAKAAVQSDSYLSTEKKKQLFVVLGTAAILVTTLLLVVRPEPRPQINTQKTKHLTEIENAKARLCRWQNIDQIKTESLKQSYLNELFYLGRLQLRSQAKGDWADAEKTYSDALLFCTKHNQPDDRKVACLALKAKSEWMQDKAAQSENDFKTAIRLLQKNSGAAKHADSIWIDVMLEKTRLEIHQRQLRQARFDFASALKAICLASSYSIIANLDPDDQRIDIGGDKRAETIEQIARDLHQLQPQNDKETVEMVVLSNVLSSKYSRNSEKAKALAGFKFTESLLANLPGNESLKRETQRLKAAYE